MHVQQPRKCMMSRQATVPSRVVFSFVILCYVLFFNVGVEALRGELEDGEELLSSQTGADLERLASAGGTWPWGQQTSHKHTARVRRTDGMDSAKRSQQRLLWPENPNSRERQNSQLMPRQAKPVYTHKLTHRTQTSRWFKAMKLFSREL